MFLDDIPTTIMNTRNTGNKKISMLPSKMTIIFVKMK